ncbi:protein phosphatase 2C domain-containing protein [Streptomyces sp. NPDC086549]|uniref:protein phosphatase 2C domain-containing protein n=1 Tax=Streptomyces sp. NPDC086549 TaxID=3365752 RepID=UPI003828AD32
MAGTKGTLTAAAGAVVALGSGVWWLLRAATRPSEDASGSRVEQPGDGRTHPPGSAGGAPQGSGQPPPEAVVGTSEAPRPLTPSPPPVPAAGRGFPVLARASRAAAAPWLLPAAGSAQHGIAADCAVLGGLRIRAASVVGPSHRGRAVPRQDAYRIGRDAAGRYLVAAVADGMSDSRHSDVGANVATAALVAALRDALDAHGDPDRIDTKQVFLAAAGQMYRAAEQRGWDADDVRAVAVTAVVPAHPDPVGVRRVWLAAIADVSAWRLREGRWQQLIGEEKGGLDASAVAGFLPHDPARFARVRAELGPGDVLALTSDGVADAFTVVPGARAWFAERWERPPAIGDFMLQVGFEQAQLQDDRTAVVVWPDDREGRG